MFVCIPRRRTRRMLLGTAAVLAAAAAALTLLCRRPPAAAAAMAQEWGLSFGQEDEPPTPNATAQELRPYDAFYCGDPAQKRIYLTFDVGYENGCTAAILDALKKHSAPAAFFVVGTYIRDEPELVRRMVREGHIVGNHTWHHPDMRQKSREAFARELQEPAALFEATTGRPMDRFYRPPEGKFSAENLLWAKELGYKTIFWSLAYVDYDTEHQPTREKAFAKLLPRTHGGTIVLLHSTSTTNAAILDDLLSEWERAGYTFGRLTELGAAAAAGDSIAAPPAAAAGGENAVLSADTADASRGAGEVIT